VEARRAPADAVQHLLRARRGLDLNLETVTNGRREPALEKQAIVLLQRVHELLMRPVEDLIGGHGRLVIVPHGVLHGIPFAALHNGVEYLVQRCELVLEPSASAVKFCRRPLRSTSDERALVIAHSADGLLPGATREAEAVAGLFEADCLLEAEASVDNVCRASARTREVIHIAAHGRSRPDAPLFSHIRLADGQLTALDCLRLPLECDLVTLSACDTGHAVVAAGDEPIGLTRSLLYAGARSVIQSLWRVDDDVTRRLMVDMYTRLRDGASRAAALREAQCAILSGEAAPHEKHPAFWAAFSLVGDWRPLR
jgi:CHAT domain-containing protein